MRGHPSYTSLTLFDSCQAAWAAAYLRGEPAVVPENVKRGKQIHKACELYAKNCKANRAVTDFDFGRHLAAGMDGSARADFERWVENWTWEWDTVKAAPIEGHLEAYLPDGVTVFTGHPDLVQQVEGSASAFGEGDDLWVVTDFKSHFHGWPKEPPQQLLWYAWLVQRNWPEARDFLLVIAPLDGGPARQWAVGGAEVAGVGETLQAKCDFIAAETEYAAEPGAACFGCFYRAACPHRNSTTLDLYLSDPERVAEEGQWYAAQADVARDLTKAYCQEHGALLGRFEPSVASGLEPENPATLETDLRRYGLSPIDLRGSWDKGKIGRAAKQLEKAGQGAEGFLALFRQTKPQVRWGWAKGGAATQQSEACDAQAAE